MMKSINKLIVFILLIFSTQQISFSQVISGALPDYGNYTIACVSGGKFIEVSGDTLQNEKFYDQRLIVQNASSISNSITNNWQVWQFIYKTTVNGTKYYHIRNTFSGKYIEVPGGSLVSGIQVQQYLEFIFLSDQQLWKVEEISTGKYRITNKGSGLALANSSTTNGSPITQETITNTDNQTWILNAKAPISYRDDQVNRFFNRNSTSQGSVAFDQGSSIPLSNGKVLWVTQDSWDGSSIQPNGLFSCSNFFSYGNSMFLQPTSSSWDANSAPNITRTGSAQNRPNQICDIQPNNTFAWPANGVEIGNHVYIQCGEGQGLTATDQSLYDLTESDGSVWSSVRTLPAGLSGQTNINYSSGMVKAKDGYVYAFGAKATGYGYTLDVYVARFPVSNPQIWTFWDGTNWVSAPVVSTAARIGQGRGSAAVSYINGKYVLITLDQGFNCDNSRDIYGAIANTPTSGFSATLTKIYAIKEYMYGKYARFYTPNIHPQSANGRNELLITYSLNYSACNVVECVNTYLDPYFYRVKGVRVPYTLLGIPNDGTVTEIENIKIADEFEIYPNPASETIQVVSKETINTIKLFDIQGRLVLTSIDRNINISSLDKGLYIIYLQTNSGTSVGRFVKN